MICNQRKAGYYTNSPKKFTLKQRCNILTRSEAISKGRDVIINGLVLFLKKSIYSALLIFLSYVHQLFCIFKVNQLQKATLNLTGGRGMLA